MSMTDPIADFLTRIRNGIVLCLADQLVILDETMIGVAREGQRGELERVEDRLRAESEVEPAAALTEIAFSEFDGADERFVRLRFQPDLGTGIVFIGIFFAMLTLALSMVLFGILVGVAFYMANEVTANAGQINPFFRGPPGVDTADVSWSADDLFGSGASATVGANTGMQSNKRLL